MELPVLSPRLLAVSEPGLFQTQVEAPVMGFLASGRRVLNSGWCPGPEVQASSLLGNGLGPSLPPKDTLSWPSPSLPAHLITDLHSESSLLFC